MTNNDIKKAFYDLLIEADLKKPIAYQGIDFKTPDEGQWLETAFAPNSGLDNSLAYDSGVIPRGILQVACYDRGGKGSFGVDKLAQDVADVFTKGTTLTGSVRVVSYPFIMPLDSDDDSISVIVSVEYSG